MVALAILVVSLSILLETQASSTIVTRESERVITASDLAYAKLNEAILYVEEEGFQQSQIVESGDFDDFGDDATSMDIADELEDYHWEFTVTEIDLALARGHRPEWPVNSRGVVLSANSPRALRVWQRSDRAETRCPSWA